MSVESLLWISEWNLHCWLSIYRHSLQWKW